MKQNSFAQPEWVGICVVRLQPLVDALRDLLLTERALHAGETPVPMLALGKKKAGIYDFTDRGRARRPAGPHWCSGTS
jgi:hypothetical protein